VLSVSFNQGFDESSFAHSRRSNHSDNDWGSFFGEAVYKRDMEALFFDLGQLLASAGRIKEGGPIHHASAQPAWPVDLDWQIRKLWDFCLSGQHVLVRKQSVSAPASCFFFFFSLVFR